MTKNFIPLEMEFTVENNAAITTIRGVRGTLGQVDVDVLIDLSKKLLNDKNSKYLETGSYLGCSSLIIALHSNATIWAHDIWVEDWSELGGGPPPEVKDYFYEFYKMVKDNDMIKRIIPIRGKSSYTVGIHDDNSIDLAFIDGDHSYNGCLSDLNVVFPKMKKTGIILVHDCAPESDCMKAVLKFSEDCKAVQTVNSVINSCGMVIIKLC